VKVANTVGAGDVCAASSIKVQTLGAKKGLPDNEKIERFFEEKGKKPVQIIEKP